MTTTVADNVARTGSSAPDVDPGWYAGQPETADAVPPDTPGQPAGSHVPSVLQKLLKWGNYAGYGAPVWPSRFIPMKTPLSEEILDSWELPEPPKHRLTVPDLLAAQAAAGRHVGLLLDLSNHDCLYASDVPSSVQYLHVQLVAKELPQLEFVHEVGRAANRFWSQHSDDFIAVHCAYGFNRTGFVVCSYLIESCGLSVEQALASFARSRPPGVKHERFRDELHARYGSVNQAVPRAIACVHAAAHFAAACGASSSSDGDGCEQELRGLVPLFMQPQWRMQAGVVQQQQQQQGRQCSSSTQAWREQPPASNGRCRCSGSCQCDEAATCGDLLPCTNSNSTSTSKQHATSPVQCNAAGAFSTPSRTVSFACDDEEGGFPEQQRLPARCYSSCSVGDNSSIGCSPDSQAEFLLHDGNGCSSSVLDSIRGYRVPLGLMGCRPVQGVASQQQQQQIRADSPAGSSGRLTQVVSQVSDAVGAQQQQSEEDLDGFELDPCGEERASSAWCDGSSCCSAAQQQQHPPKQPQHAGDMSSLLSGLEAVHLGPRQQQRQQFEQPSPGQTAASCPCSCHVTGRPPNSCGGESTDAAAEQLSRQRRSRLRHSSEGSGRGLGSSSGGVLELQDNESFGKVTSAELLKNLRALQQDGDAH